MKIGIDIMGGDFAPEATVLGAIDAIHELPEDVGLVLFGDKETALSFFKGNTVPERIEFIHTTEVIKMSEHPAKTFANKPDSSIVIGFSSLKSGYIDAFTSAGNTGAMLVGSMYTIKSIPGIIRPCISVSVPRLDGGSTILLDVGINPDCRPDVLYQYGLIGSLYAKHIYNIPDPKVALLNIGEEKEKGNLLTKATHELMEGSKDFNFIGNIEGNDFYDGKSDVVICDGFTGNVVLKNTEAFYEIAKLRNIKDDYIDKFNFESIGGTPVLGISGTVTIGHGKSTPLAIKNMILHTYDVAKARLFEKINEAFNK